MKSMIKMMLGLAIMGTMPMMVACSDDDKDVVDPTPVEDPKFDIVSELLDPPTFSFSSEGQKAQTLEFNTNQAWKIDIVDNQENADYSWLTLFDREGDGKSNETSKVYIAADQNRNYDARRAEFTLTCGNTVKTFFVYQAQKDAILVTDPKAYMNLSSDEQVIPIQFKCNIDAYTVDVSDKTWMQQVEEPRPNATRAMYDETIYVKIGANDKFDSRGGTIKITNTENNQVTATVTVIQFGLAKPTIMVNNADFFAEMPAAGDSTELDLSTTNVASVCDQLTIDIPATERDWISFHANEDSTGYVLKVAENTGGNRSTTVSVCAKSDHTVKYDIPVKQASAEGVLITISNKDKLKDYLDKMGGAFSVKYSTETDNWDCKIEDEDGNEASWIRVANKKVAGQLVVTYDENPNMLTRTAIIKVFPAGNEGKADRVAVVQAKGTSITVEGSLQATLDKLVKAEIFESVASITSLELKGQLSGQDWALLKTMLTSGKGYKLNTLNLEKVTNTSMAANQFNGCTQLKNIVFPATLRETGERICQGCTGLNSAKFPEGIEYLANHFFNGCTTLKEVWIPSTMGYLYGSVFEKCSSLKKIHLQCLPLQITQVARSATQPTTPSEVFANQKIAPKLSTLYVPTKYVDYYKYKQNNDNLDPQHVANSHLSEYLKKLNATSEEWTKGTAAFDWKPGTAALKGQFAWTNSSTKVVAEDSWDAE